MKNSDEKVNAAHSAMHKSGILGGGQGGRDYSHT